MAAAAASSTFMRTTPQPSHRYRYTMLPSKHDESLRVRDVPDQSLDDERGEYSGRTANEYHNLPWKKQAVSDLKPSYHRET